MNIALFASAFYPHIGGVEELVRQLSHAYREAGHQAIVVTNQWPPTLPAYEEYENIPTYRLPMRMPEGNLKQRLKYRLTQSRTERELLAILRHHAIQLIHVQCVSVNGYYALLAAQALKLPLVVTAQGERTMDAGKIYERSSFINQVLRDLLARSGAITACSRDTLADIETFYGQPFGNRSQVVYNGIRLDDFTVPKPYLHPKPYIFGIGRLVPQKGFDILINAFARANIETHDLLIAGEGTERQELEELIKNLDVQDRVHLLGRADRADVVALFKGCSFFVLPSRQEPQGIVNLEAMAAGKAVVAARVGGVPEIVVDGITGILIPGDNIPAMTHALLQLANDPGLCAHLGATGHMRAQDFAWPSISQRYITIYNSLLPGIA